MKTPIFKRSYDLEQSLESYSCHCGCSCASCVCDCGCLCHDWSLSLIDEWRLWQRNDGVTAQSTFNTPQQNTLHGIGSTNRMNNMAIF